MSRVCAYECLGPVNGALEALHVFFFFFCVWVCECVLFSVND